MDFMNQTDWLSSYFNKYRESIFSPDVNARLVELKEMILAANQAGKKIIVAGNGGSAAMASHVSVDLTKTANIRAINFNESDLITCFANDYGYEHWVAKALEFYADEGDVAILISSSGKSPNMVNAGRTAVERKLQLATFTGFTPDNPLRSLGKHNFWVDSRLYNIVENTHIVWLLAICDLIIESQKKG